MPITYGVVNGRDHRGEQPVYVPKEKSSKSPWPGTPKPTMVDGLIYPSMEEAAKSLGMTRDCMSRKLKLGGIPGHDVRVL